MINPRFLFFNLVSIISCILLLLSLAFVQKPQNIVFIPIQIFIVLAATTTLIRSHKAIEFFKLLYVFGIGILFRIITAVQFTPNDVYWGSKESIDGILKGMNPYNMTFTIFNYAPGTTTLVNSTISAGNQPYLPVTFLFELPFQVILHDLRWGIVFADVGIAVLLYLILREKDEDIARAVASFYMLVVFFINTFSSINSPITEYRIFNGITDPIWIFLIFLSVYFYMKNRQLLASIFIGLSIATKQFALLFFILMIIMWLNKDQFGKRQYKLIAISTLIPIVIILPFLLSDPTAFIFGTMTYQPTHYLEAAFGSPQWNEAIFPQFLFLGLNFTLVGQKIVQIVAVLLTLIYFRNKIRNIQSSLKVFSLIYILFLTFNNSTQFFYWFSVIPFLIVSFVYDFKEHQKITKGNEAQNKE